MDEIASRKMRGGQRERDGRHLSQSRHCIRADDFAISSELDQSGPFRRFALVHCNCFRPSSRLRQSDIVSYRCFRFQAHRSMSVLSVSQSSLTRMLSQTFNPAKTTLHALFDLLILSPLLIDYLRMLTKFTKDSKI